MKILYKMQGKAWTFTFATEKTNYQVLIDESWKAVYTDTVSVTGGYVGYFGLGRAIFLVRSVFSLCNYEDGYIWDFDIEEGEEEVGGLEANIIDTIVTNDTEGISSKIVN